MSDEQTTRSDGDASEFGRVLEEGGVLGPDEGTWGWTPGRIAATVLLLGIVGFWMWAFSPLAPNTHPDELDDPTWAEAARPLCEDAQAAIDELPLASEARTMDERADQVDAGTAVYRELITSLTSFAPAVGTDDGDAVHAWLDDYSTYLGDRDRYVADLRDGIDEPFSTHSKARRQITIPIDEFAKANRIAACVTPEDV